MEVNVFGRTKIKKSCFFIKATFSNLTFTYTYFPWL